MVLIKSKPDTMFNDRFVPGAINHFMNAFFDDSKLHNNAMAFMPKADVLEKEQHYEIHMALPGIKKEDIKISVDGDMLNIEGERKSVINESTDKVLRSETTYGKFSRSFNVSKLDTSAIEAVFQDGMLKLSIPKQATNKQSIIAIQ
jgi:HSP20 family protein